LEYALKPDFAFIHAHTTDTEGNCRYSKTARNFNPVMASAAKVTIVEAENIVQPGDIDPDCIHTPGIYVKRVVQVPRIKIRVGID
jgi:acyl CoA:acetate/3-ketoacid CoA transferase alpha subunit